MIFLEQLRQRAEETKSIVCMGIDPVLSRIPIKEGNKEEILTKFYLDLLKAMVTEQTFPAIVKPNIAFFEQYGIGGLRALKNIIEAYQGEGVPVLLDAKRGDIGKTSKAYAVSCFDGWNADALTVAPYMGNDSVGPFIEYCDQGKGVYILCRTSNKGAVDMQNLEVGGTPIYMKVAEKIVEWHKPGVGAVVGATYPQELEQISKFFVDSGKEIPMLIPGVGSQGGSAEEVVEALKKSGNDLTIHRINSSSGINFAYEKQDTEDYAGAAVKAIKELNKEIGIK
ncbi:orotidine-5'-phosphate decarboxylase [Candidatus Woesearchaeota archaeon]|nr:orotidine-5'-phosphate decarboxylase [Candidatus Woesearchaeota archaeon]